MKQNPLAIFDIDGTLFRSSLLIELNDRLVQKGIFPDAAKEDILKARDGWLNRQGDYTDYVDWIIKVYARDIKGKYVSKVQEVCQEVAFEQKDRVYAYTRDLIKQLRTTHQLMCISTSPSEIVSAFAKFHHFDIVSGTQYESKRGRFTGTVPNAENINKRIVLQRLLTQHNINLENSIGIGDTESDISFLELVSTPIVFNPNSLLSQHAKKNNWKIIVERKDVIYEL